MSPCPPGTYNDGTGGGLYDSRDCTPCPAGHYCPEYGDTKPPTHTDNTCTVDATATDSCDWCSCTNAYTAVMTKTITDIQNSAFTPEVTTGATCVECTRECDAGFICYLGAYKPEPIDTVTGDYCPKGGYCLRGSIA